MGGHSLIDSLEFNINNPSLAKLQLINYHVKHFISLRLYQII